ncbi:hypothetical protein EDD15DRAFT_2371426 [Pisolithus albus]|nr:hypothetical protein EDD15DRAFT_2371426 [Pisolithus albus]
MPLGTSPYPYVFLFVTTYYLTSQGRVPALILAVWACIGERADATLESACVAHLSGLLLGDYLANMIGIPGAPHISLWILMGYIARAEHLSGTGLAPEHLAVAVTTGFMTITELDALMRLIRSPDSHFVEVPSLPFYFLTSILSKFPAEVESRAYWSAGVIDALFGRALNVLVTRFQEHRQADDLRLLNDLLEVGMSCQAFTTQQVKMMMTIEP